MTECHPCKALHDLNPLFPLLPPSAPIHLPGILLALPPPLFLPPCYVLNGWASSKCIGCKLNQQYSSVQRGVFRKCGGPEGSALKETSRSPLPVWPSSFLPHEDTVPSERAANWNYSSVFQQTPNLLAPWTWTLSLQNREEEISVHGQSPSCRSCVAAARTGSRCLSIMPSLSPLLNLSQPPSIPSFTPTQSHGQESRNQVPCKGIKQPHSIR